MKLKRRAEPTPDLVEWFDEDEVPQRSDAWLAHRLGLPTASEFSSILAGGEGATRKSYMKKLAGEILTGEISEGYRNLAMDRGIEMEAEALAWYQRENLVELERIGFVRRTIYPALGAEFTVGASPDAVLPGRNALVEVKTMRPDLLIDVALKGAAGFPIEHRAQIQGQLWITGAEWCDLIIYYRGWKSPPRFRVERDEAYIATLARAVEQFQYELDRLVEDVQRRSR